MVLLGVKFEPVVREVVGFGELLDEGSEEPFGGRGPTLLVQEVEPDRPCGLMAAMLAAEFIHPALDASIKAKVVAVKC